METEIRNQLAELLKTYRELEVQVAQMAKLESAVDRMQASVQVNSRMSEVKSIEGALMQMRSQFESSGGSYSDATKKLVEESKSVLAESDSTIERTRRRGTT